MGLLAHRNWTVQEKEKLTFCIDDGVLSSLSSEVLEVMDDEEGVKLVQARNEAPIYSCYK